MIPNKKLTPKKAEKFAKKIYHKFNDPVEIEFYQLHSQHVVEIALILASKKKIDKNVLQIAGWLHDIGAIIKREHHAKTSITILQQEGYIISDILKDCILNHGGDMHPKTPEGKIIQIADKASILRPEIIKLFIDSDKKKIPIEDIHYLKKTTSKAIPLLEQYTID